jgi:hypothetical protein
MRPATSFVLSLLAVAAVSAGLRADEAPAGDAGKAPNELGFLEAGKDYVIRFPASLGLFRSRTSGISETTYTTSDGKTEPGKPATWTVTTTVEVFRVVRFGGGSWVQLEHPAREDDFMAWNAKRRAMAKLADGGSLPAESDPDGKVRLEQLREAAAREIPTTRTWVNLAHAVAITDVPTEDAKLEVKVRSVEVKHND